MNRPLQAVTAGLLRRRTYFVIALLILTGCAAPVSRGPEEATRSVLTSTLSPGRIAIVGTNCEPAASFNRYTQGKGAEAASEAGRSAIGGAITGALFPFQAVGNSRPLAFLAVAMMPFTMAVGAVVGGAVGAAQGASQGMSSEDTAAIREPIDRAQRDGAVQERFAGRLAATGEEWPEYQFELRRSVCGESLARDALKAEGFDAALEVKVTSIGFDAKKRNKDDLPQVAFVMAVEAQRVLLDGSANPTAWTFSHRGPTRTTTAWAVDGERLLEVELTSAYAELSRQLLEVALRPFVE